MSTAKVIISYPWIEKGEKYLDENGNEPFIQPSKGLRECVAEVARKELREEIPIREASLHQFKEWIRQNHDLENCITGKFLLVS